MEVSDENDDADIVDTIAPLNPAPQNATESIDYESMFNNLSASLENKEAECRAWREKFERLLEGTEAGESGNAEKVISLESSLEEATSINADLKSKTASLESSLEEATNNNADLKSKTASLESSLEETTNNNADLQRRNSSLENNISSLEIDLQEARDAIARKEEVSLAQR